MHALEHLGLIILQSTGCRKIVYFGRWVAVPVYLVMAGYYEPLELVRYCALPNYSQYNGVVQAPRKKSAAITEI